MLHGGHGAVGSKSAHPKSHAPTHSSQGHLRPPYAGPAVMKGYYKNDKATHAAFPFGDDWFDTGMAAAGLHRE